jgi:predicted glycogen debranching enzyme
MTHVLTRYLPLPHQPYEYCSIDPYADSEKFVRTEWLLTNGLGGYASSSISGVTTRRYHGVLVAALPPPFGRTIMLNHLAEQVICPDGKRFWIGCEEKADGDIHLDGMNYLKEFRLEMGLPVWVFEVNGLLIEKRILLIHQQNTVHISYKMITPTGKVRLKIQPSLHFRPHEAPVDLRLGDPYVLTATNHHYEIVSQPYPPLRLIMHGLWSKFTLESKVLKHFYYRIESRRGYESIGDLWTPGYFKVDLESGQEATLISSTESWDTMNALTPKGALEAEFNRRRDLLNIAPSVAVQGMGSELILAADQFIITPSTRVEDAARARAAGGEIRTIIAGYHWFTDWGRDTMISLEGLTINTGRQSEAKWILKTFAHYVKDGLIPNMFPEGQNEGLYHTADATVWFFHALDRYVTLTGDRDTLKQILPKLLEIYDNHMKGTHFRIGIDAKDHLLKQGAEGYQLTWMDAKVGDWVVTPRRGKPVEINALWYNALRLLEEWIKEEQGEEAAKPFKEQADQTFRSFNDRFWYSQGGYLYDVIDGEQGDDSACRPNQILAISLKYPVLDHSHWEEVVNIVHQKLLTPYGLRSLSPDHSDYKSRYDGDLRARDAAYHQGTVWAWLIGPFIDAWLKIHPEDLQGARRFLQGFESHLNDAAIGSINEVFDAVEPYTPRGCVAQAWSVAEVLRCWVKTASPEVKP